MKRFILLTIGLGVWAAGYYCGQIPGSPDLHGWVQDRGDLDEQAQRAKDHPAAEALNRAAGFLRAQATAAVEAGRENSPVAETPAESQSPPSLSAQAPEPSTREPVPQCW